MNIRFSILFISLVLASEAYAQAEQTPETLVDEEPVAEEVTQPDPEPEETPDTGVVDVNEDFFRRSMELQDRGLQRSPSLTTGTYSRSTAQQSLERLPDESQKHLREQMREVIVENGPWAPEDEGTEYPYVPSERAERNRTLAGREQAAWSEMVSEYHEREASIHANAARTEAATATGQNQQGELAQGETGEMSQPGGENGQSGEDGQQDQDAARAERAAALAEMLNEGETGGGQAGTPPAEPVESGTAQNALELLTQRNQVPAQAASAASQSSNTRAVSVEVAQSSTEAEVDSESDTSVPEEPETVIESIGVIAIEDLENVRVDPEDQDEN